MQTTTPPPSAAHLPAPRRRRSRASVAVVAAVAVLTAALALAVACRGSRAPAPRSADVHLAPVTAAGDVAGSVHLTEELGGTSLEFQVSGLPVSSGSAATAYRAVMVPGGCDSPADPSAGTELLPLFVGSGLTTAGGHTMLPDATLDDLHERAIEVVDPGGRLVLCGVIPAVANAGGS